MSEGSNPRSRVEALEVRLRVVERENHRLSAEMERMLQVISDAVNVGRAKNQFLANMSHELRTPLNAIIGYAEMLEEDAEDLELPDFVADLRKITSAGKHLLGIIGDVLDLSKIEAGKMKLYLEPVPVTQVLDAIQTLFRTLVERSGNRFEVHHADDLGVMVTDIVKLRQILLNLLSNANKFTDDGVITITVQGDADTLTFEVRDTGVGIASEKLTQVFEPFTQADASTTREYGGTGLGLTLCRKFCELLGGTISVESELGVGTAFTVRLPRETQAEE